MWSEREGSIRDAERKVGAEYSVLVVATPALLGNKRGVAGGEAPLVAEVTCLRTCAQLVCAPPWKASVRYVGDSEV